MQKLIQNIADWRRGDWRDLLPRAPASIAQRWPGLYLSIALLFTIPVYLISLGFPLTALAVLVDLSQALGSTRDLIDWPTLLLEVVIVIGAGAMTVFLWRQRMPLPSGWPLEAAARLPFDEFIESIRADVRLPPPKEVRITERHQVASVCVPRNGLPLFNRKVLLMGLPTLQALTTRQVEAAVRRALCPPDTLRGWALQAITCHYECTDQYQVAYRNERSIAGRIMAALFGFYWKTYQWWSRPAVQWNELERDTLLNQQICVDHVLELIAVDALVRRYLGEMFWPPLFDAAKRDAKPPYPHAKFRRTLREQLTQRVIDQWLDEAAIELQPENALSPAMSARLANLGSQRPDSVSLDGENAAETLLGESLIACISQTDKTWRSRVRHRWQKEHDRHAKGRACLMALHRRSQTRGIQGHHAMTYAKLAKHYLAPDEAVSVYRYIAETNPDDAMILLRVGRLLLSHSIEDGAALVNRAVQMEARLTVKARKILAHFGIATESGAMSKTAAGAAA